MLIEKRSIEKLDFLLNQRKLKQLKQSSSVKKILANVKKNGDKAVINYEKNFLI